MIRQFGRSNFDGFRNWFAECYRLFDNIIRAGGEIYCETQADALGTKITISDSKRTLSQNAKIHVILRDFIKDQSFGSDMIVEVDGKKVEVFVKFCDVARKKNDQTTMRHAKAVLMNWFVADMAEMGMDLSKKVYAFFDVRTQSYVSNSLPTSELSKKEASEFIDWLYAIGTEHGIRWSDESLTVVNSNKR